MDAEDEVPQMPKSDSVAPAPVGESERTLTFAFIVNNYPPRVGGVELHVRNLARALTAAGHSVTVITLGDPVGETVEDGVEVIRLRERLRVADILGFPSLGTSMRISSLLRARAVDVVSVHTRFFPMSWVGSRAARRANAVVIHTEHGSGHVVSDSAVIRIASRVVDYTAGRAVLRNATRAVGVSEPVVAFARRLSGRDDISVFYNAIDPCPPDLDRSQRRHLVFVGRLVTGKGADLFVEAAYRLADQGEAFSAEIIGDGPNFPDLERQIARRGLTQKVVLRGRLNQEHVSRALAGGLLINPSTLAEGFQTTLLEALDAGGAVVTFDVPGAALLRSEGAPVDIVEAHDASSLAEAIRRRLATGWPPHPVSDWHWGARAAQYVALARATIAGDSSHGCEGNHSEGARR